MQLKAAPSVAGEGVDDLLQEYTLTGDDSLLLRARARLFESTSSRNAAGLLQAAWIAQAEHAFARSRQLLGEVLGLQPRNGQAWLLEASVAKVMGDVDSARRACGKVAITVSPNTSLVCFASLARSPEEQARWLHRLRTMPAPRSSDSLAAWRWSVQAELSNALGQQEEAEQLWKRSIGLFPAVQTRVSLIDLLLRQHRYDEILELAFETDSAPALALRRLVAQRESGIDTAALSQRYDARFRHWIMDNDMKHAREMTMFYLDIQSDPQLAYALAQANIEMQREPEDIALLRRARSSFGVLGGDEVGRTEVGGES